MSMFDYVNYEMDCPKCGHKVTRFQSKDRDCEMKTIEFWEVDCFYSHCCFCDTWIEFRLKAPRPQLPIRAYQMSVKMPKENGE